MASVFKRGGRRAKGYYYVSWTDHRGKRQTRCARTTDKAAAERIAKKHETEAAERREGIIDAGAERMRDESRRPIAELAEAFQAKMIADGRTAKHIQQTVKYVGDVAEHAGFATAADVTADGVADYVVKLAGEGKSDRTRQAVLTSLKAFSRWLAQERKLPFDPLAHISKPSVTSDYRRPLLPEEWPWLEMATLAAGERFGMTGAERRLLYLTAIQTGLRAGELRTLTRGLFHLKGGTPFIVAKAANTKNRKQARQYVRPELAGELAEHIRRKVSSAPVFSMPDETEVAAMIRADLADARKSWLAKVKDDPQQHAQREESDFLAVRNHDGLVFDFHSLRHSCGTWLALAGVDTKTLQTIMRHSTPILTIQRYGHLMEGAEAAAVAKLDTIAIHAAVSLAATGTENSAPLSSAKNHPATGGSAAHGAARSTRNVATEAGGFASDCDNAVSLKLIDEAADGEENPQETSDFDGSPRENAAGEKLHKMKEANAPCRARTCDPLIKSQLLCQLS